MKYKKEALKKEETKEKKDMKGMCAKSKALRKK